MSNNEWVSVCNLNDIVPNTGVCALVGEAQVAIFRIGDTDEVHALSNFDPFGNANVLSRGLIGDIGGELVVASPLYKQHFKLTTGECLEDDDVKIDKFDVRVNNNKIEVQANA